ncbi:unnamed protein product, partial [marine sediment metagenome]
VDSLNDRLARIEFSQAHPDIDAGDIEQIFDLAGLQSKTPDKILEDNDMVKTYLEKKLSEKKVQDAIPSNNRSSVSGPDKPKSEWTREEHKEWAEKMMNQ